MTGESGIRGDFGKLNALAAMAGRTHQRKLELAEKMSEWIRKTIDREFFTHADPYGKRWPGRKQPDRRTNPLMVRTGDLMTGFAETATADGVKVENAVPYAEWLNDGTRKMPPRIMLPGEYGGLGLWGEPLVRLALDALRLNFKGAF